MYVYVESERERWEYQNKMTKFWKTHKFKTLPLYTRLSFDEHSWFQWFSCLINHCHFMGLFYGNLHYNVITCIKLHFMAAHSWFKGWKIKQHVSAKFCISFLPSLPIFEGKRVEYSQLWWFYGEKNFHTLLVIPEVVPNFLKAFCWYMSTACISTSRNLSSGN